MFFLRYDEFLLSAMNLRFRSSRKGVAGRIHGGLTKRDVQAGRLCYNLILGTNCRPN